MIEDKEESFKENTVIVFFTILISIIFLSYFYDTLHIKGIIFKGTGKQIFNTVFFIIFGVGYCQLVKNFYIKYLYTIKKIVILKEILTSPFIYLWSLLLFLLTFTVYVYLYLLIMIFLLFIYYHYKLLNNLKKINH